MTPGDIAGLIAAIAFAVLVLALAVPLFMLGGVFKELRDSIRNLTEETLPTVKDASVAMTQVNEQLERVDKITQAAGRSVEDVSALTTLITATLGRPLIKISALSYATRRALGIDKGKEV